MDLEELLHMQYLLHKLANKITLEICIRTDDDENIAKTLARLMYIEEFAS